MHTQEEGRDDTPPGPVDAFAAASASGRPGHHHSAQLPVAAPSFCITGLTHPGPPCLQPPAAVSA